MQNITTRHPITLSYNKDGSGPPLVLIHGSFTDHITNWELVKPLFEQQFTVYAIARRGRGETTATVDHSLEDESLDVVTLIQAIDEPVFLLGHSYGAQTALAAAAQIPSALRSSLAAHCQQRYLRDLGIIGTGGRLGRFCSDVFPGYPVCSDPGTRGIASHRTLVTHHCRCKVNTG